MPQDAFTLKYITEELKENLIGGKISKIAQPQKEELSFIIYTRKGNIKLTACLSAKLSRLSIGEADDFTPLNPSNFCMLLRKHLQNAKITDIRQPDFERIIYFDLECVSDFSSSVKRLYFEIMGKYSNCVLCENGIILGALKTNSIGENTKRLILGGAKYSLPEKQDKANVTDLEEVEKVLKREGEKAKAIADGIKGISYAAALEIVEKYGESVTAQNIYDYIFNESAYPCVTFSGGEPTDFKVRSQDKDVKYFESVLKAQAFYYDYVKNKQNFQTEKNRLISSLSSAVKKAEKRLFKIERKIDECAGSENIKLKGELIIANLFLLKRGMKSFEAVNYYDENGGTVKIDLDETLSPSANAQRYYKKYEKLKRTYISVSAQKKETQDRLDYLTSILTHINCAENLCDLQDIAEELTDEGILKKIDVKKKKSEPSPYRIYEVGEFKILSGRNNLQNERLTKSLAPDDIWVHTQKYHSSHVGIICGGKTPPDGVIKTACEICAYYSEARSGTKIPVDYALKKYVKKPPKSNAGFFIYTDYKTALAEPNANTAFLKE